MEEYLSEGAGIVDLDEKDKIKREDCIEYLTHLPQDAYDLFIEGINIRRNAEKKFQEMEEKLDQAAEEEMSEAIKTLEEESKDKKTKEKK